jgi:LCP family protein required for cell wall assembly
MAESARHRHRAPRRPLRRPLVVLALAVAIVAIAVAGTLFAVSERLGDDVVPDPFAVIEFAGVRSVVDAIGGVDVGVAAPTSSAGVAFQAGADHLDGDAALVYVRQRHELVSGDLARAARRRNVLGAVLGKLVDGAP